uniref:Cytochrome c oxidase subunit 3 n=1 Tax=Rhinebothrium sp. LRP 10407 TaxID=2899471 RepID=A0A8K1W4R0_9CEST|nr:cytochrome c oxidase subunit III [Rhinebothrium sp. LRP 10407]
MSFLPLSNSFLAGSLLATLFLWKVWALPVVSCTVILVITFFWFELMDCNFHFVSSFWLFILSEIMAFGSILFCCFYFDTQNSISLSSPLELPFLGCFILLGSSVTITGFHHLMPWSYSWVLISLTVILGVSFVFLQLAELNEISLSMTDSSFHASSFCTVGLHFSHVLLGVVAMITLLIIGVQASGEYRCTLITWYWHFVDYIWLFVYTIVYVC